MESWRARALGSVTLAASAAVVAALAAGGCQSSSAPEVGGPAAVDARSTGERTEIAAPKGYKRLRLGVHPAATPERDRGPAPRSRRISNLSMAFNLSPAQLADREALKAALVDPKSPQYRKFLKPAEYAARFGAPRGTIERAKSWLALQGLEVHEDSPLGARVTFSGTVETLERAFKTQIHSFEVGESMHYSMRLPPALPSDMADAVAEISNTHDFHPKPTAHGMHPVPDYQTGKIYGFTAIDWANVYNASPLYTTGVGGKVIDGTGITVAVVGVAEIAPSDEAAWRTSLNLGPSHLSTMLVPNTGNAAAGSGGSGFEADLDVEWSGGIAPGATVKYYFTGDTDGNVDDATYYIIENNLGDVINESFGGGECFYVQFGFGPAQQNLIDIYGSSANLLGITYVAASGDAGAAGCANEGVAGLWVDYPAAYPGVTAVGGTQFGVSGFNGQTPYFTTYSNTEAVWLTSDSASNPGGGGGGISTVFDRPSYQIGLQTCTPLGSLPVKGIDPTKQRQSPDVAFTASNGLISEFMECTIVGNDCGVNGGNAKFYAGGGTSFAAPAFSGAVALMLQAGGGRLGNINPLLYSLAQTTPTAFHDVTMGNNEIACKSTDPGCGPGNLYGYPATTGYDCATGLGSVNIFNVVSAIAGEAATTTTLALAPTSTTEGAPVMFTATVDVPQPNAMAVSGIVTFTFQSYDQNNEPDESWTLGTGSLTGATTAEGQATYSGFVPPGLVKPGMQSVDCVAMYGGDPSHLPSVSKKVPLAFGPLAFAVTPTNPTVAPNGKLAFMSTGGISPVQWFTTTDTTCNMGNPPVCSTIDQNTGAFVAGPMPGKTGVQALDADGAEVTVNVTVACMPLTACPAGLDCGSLSDGCGGTLDCGSCSGSKVCGGGGTANVCGCMSSCPSGQNCGMASDGCGGMITCGNCTSPQTCGGGTPGECGCAPATTCAAGEVCGMGSDGCGGMIECGSCESGETCTNNHCVGAASVSSSNGAGGSATTSSGAGGGSSAAPAADKNCSCRAAGETGGSEGAGLSAAALLMMLARRRRTSRKG